MKSGVQKAFTVRERKSFVLVATNKLVMNYSKVVKAVRIAVFRI